MKNFRVFGVASLLILLALGSVVVMLLWNWLLPTLMGVGTISFLQAVGIFALARILFGGVGSGRLFTGGLMRGEDREHINPLREKWMNMSKEEQKDFIYRHHEQHHGKSFCGGPDVSSSEENGASPSDNGKRNE
ncbi:MAG: hypothetical protein LBT16_11730 [Treponema sp.]|jgi:hypothetical protein|nr:hypothetical protein [Treponema sp.]